MKSAFPTNNWQNIAPAAPYMFEVADYNADGILDVFVVDDGADYLWIDAIQVSDSQKVTLLINKNMYNEQIFSLFMPESNIMLVFDNFNE